MRPHRGQSALSAPQVVPQLEQVLTPPTQVPQVLTPATEEPFPLLVVQIGVAPVSMLAQLRRGYSGSEKNSSQTFSANSSQGGISQKP